MNAQHETKIKNTMKKQFLAGMADFVSGTIKLRNNSPSSYVAGLRMGWIAQKDYESKGGMSKFLSAFDELLNTK